MFKLNKVALKTKKEKRCFPVLKRLKTDIAQGHPMDLFLKISHCSSGKCLLEALLGRKIIQGV